MNSDGTKIPNAVRRPLIWALCGIVLFAGSFLSWAILAPLATTLRLTGALVSEMPSFEVQHPYGGQISEILVRQHSRVKQGDLLLRLDTALDRQNLSTFLDMRNRIQAENKVITRLLSKQKVQNERIGTHLILRFDQAQMQSRMKRSRAKSLARQADALREVIAHQTVQFAQMQARFDRLEPLIESALMTQTNGELLQEQIQLVKGEISSQNARLIELEDQQKQAIEQAEQMLLAIRQELTSTLESNLRQLKELAPQIANLEDVVGRADLRAPIDGVVTDLHFEASSMYAGRGQTLLSLAQPLDKPVITFNVPTHLIDQLRVGMTGRLGLPSLSQRNMPDVNITLTSISPRAELDENARPVFFEGRAELAPEDLSKLTKAVGEGFALSADMPVELLIEGRTTTFSQYLTDPLIAAFQNSLQG